MLLSPRENGLDSLFKEVRVLKVMAEKDPFFSGMLRAHHMLPLRVLSKDNIDKQKKPQLVFLARQEAWGIGLLPLFGFTVGPLNKNMQAMHDPFKAEISWAYMSTSMSSDTKLLRK